MSEIKIKIAQVKSALNLLKSRESDLIDLKDRLIIQDFQDVTGLKVGDKLNLNGYELVIVEFINLSWPVVVCTRVEGGFTYRLTDGDLKSMGITSYNELLPKIEVPKPNAAVVLERFRNSLLSTESVYRSEEDIAKGILDKIILEY